MRKQSERLSTHQTSENRDFTNLNFNSQNDDVSYLFDPKNKELFSNYDDWDEKAAKRDNLAPKPSATHPLATPVKEPSV